MRDSLQLISRRQLLKSAGLAGGGLLIGCTSAGRPDFSCCTSDATTLAASEPAMLSQWIQITPGNDVIMFLDKVEMGQGVMTSHAMLVAEELEIGLDDMKVLPAPVGRSYRNAQFKVQLTGGSSSVATCWQPLREAAAQARERLKAAAAQRWGVRDRSECKVVGRTIAYDGRSASFAELADEACRTAEISGVQPKEGPFKIIGKRPTRLDARDKVTGAAIFGIDVDVPGASVAVVVRPPVLGARISAYDEEAALCQTGCTACCEIPEHGIAIVADTFWHAQKAASELRKTMVTEGGSTLSSDVLECQREDRLVNGGVGSARAPRNLKPEPALYEQPFLHQVTMEPMNCTADVGRDYCRIWAPTQWPSGTQDVAAEITGLPREMIEVNTTFIGGGFGRRLQQDYVKQAVFISQSLNTPVKVIWTREDDYRNGFFRPSSTHLVRAEIDQNNRISDWNHNIITQSVSSSVFPDVIGDLLPDFTSIHLKNYLGAKVGIFSTIYDPSSREGAKSPPYIRGFSPQLRVKHDDPGVPIGYWRSVGHSQNAFAVESMIDELADAAGVEDTLEFRLMLLRKTGRRARLIPVLEQVRDKSDWSARRQEGRSLGVAAHKSFGTYCAQVVEIVEDADRLLSVARVDCVVDCGIVVNPNLVEAQLEGAIIFGLSAVLKQEITIEKGQILQSNFHNADILRMHECPEINVHIVESTEEPTGVGEPGVPPVAPAVCNALFAATCVRIRKLPIARSELASRMGPSVQARGSRPICEEAHGVGSDIGRSASNNERKDPS